jgi:hypothetical protein
MTTKYNIGTLNEATLATGFPNLGFINVSTDISIKDCITTAKGSSDKYIAFSNTGVITSLDTRGQCYRGNNYNPIVNLDDTTGRLFDIYGVPDAACIATTTVSDCLKGNAKAILDKEKADIEKLIADNQKEKDDVNIRLWAINKTQSYATAEQEYKNDIETQRLTAQLAELNKKKEALEAHKLSLSARNSEASILLSDKNRLLATVNSNIQQKYTKLEDVNNKINTITQDIYTNNMETKRKENIIQTLKVIIAIVVIMIVILMIYFGMDYVEANSPGAFTNFANKLNSGSSLFI